MCIPFLSCEDHLRPSESRLTDPKRSKGILTDYRFIDETHMEQRCGDHAIQTPRPTPRAGTVSLGRFRIHRNIRWIRRSPTARRRVYDHTLGIGIRRGNVRFRYSNGQLVRADQRGRERFAAISDLRIADKPLPMTDIKVSSPPGDPRLTRQQTRSSRWFRTQSTSQA